MCKSGQLLGKFVKVNLDMTGKLLKVALKPNQPTVQADSLLLEYFWLVLVITKETPLYLRQTGVKGYIPRCRQLF